MDFRGLVFRFRKVLWLLLCAAIVAALALRISTWIKSHDNPPSSNVPLKGEITYNGLRLPVEIECNCPRYLIVGKSMRLNFKASVRPAPGGPPVAAGGPHVDVASSDFFQLVPQAPGVTFVPPGLNVGSVQSLWQTGVTGQKNVELRVTASDTGPKTVDFQFQATHIVPAGDPIVVNDVGLLSWEVEAEDTAWDILEPYTYGVLLFGGLFAMFFWVDRRLRLARERAEHRVQVAKNQADANPEKARFAWDLARVKLEAYFDRNLTQVNLVFWLAVLVMAVGFAFVLTGVVLSYRHPNPADGRYPTPTAVVAAVSGIITQFIGATFMVIYRSTMAQANEFMVVLERINSAGMAVQVLDALPEGTDLKDATRAQIATLLLRAAQSEGGQTGRAGATSKAAAA